jgi:gamma-glutamyltranspeptidase/glutathione hydrolase
MKGMVVAPHSIAVEEGVKVLRKGGNAVDAAVTAAFVQCVEGIGSCGIAGFGALNVYISKSGENKVVNFHGKAGSKVKPDMWEGLLVAEARSGYGYRLKGRVNDIGYQSITTPSTLLGLCESLTRYGTVSLKEALAPAIRYAEEGFPFPGELSRSWGFGASPDAPTFVNRLRVTKAAEEIFLKNGRPYPPGENLIQRDLAETLKRIVKEGVEDFYSGEICDKMIKDLEEHGSFLTQRDLESYRVKITEPLCTEYRDCKVSTNPAPGGGITLIEMLNILEGYDLSQYDWRGLSHGAAEHMHLVASTFKAAQRDRAEFVGDPAFVDVPAERLTSKEHAAEWRERIDRGEKITIPRWVPREESSTTHISVIDSRGNAVSLTHSLGNSSGVVTPGLGFLYNDCMNCFNPIPGQPNSIAPGKSRSSGISPTIVFKKEEPFLIIGAPGGNRIIGAVAQGILNVVDHGMIPVEAVYAPRIDCQWFDTVDISRRIPSYLYRLLEEKGHRVVKSSFDYEPLARVQAILVDRERGRVLGGSDPRGGGVALSE